MSFTFTDALLAAVLEAHGVLVVDVESLEGGEDGYVAEIDPELLPGYLALAELAYGQPRGMA